VGPFFSAGGGSREFQGGSSSRYVAGWVGSSGLGGGFLALVVPLSRPVCSGGGDSVAYPRAFGVEMIMMGASFGTAVAQRRNL